VLTYKLGIVALVLSTLLQAQEEETWFDRVVELYWNGEYEQTLAVLVAVAPEALSDFERLEYYKYRGFSHMALGDLDAAHDDFIGLLSTDPGYSFDPSMVSPKIIEHLEAAKETVTKDLFSKGKAAYFDEDYETAVGLMDEILRMDPNYELALEYKQLSEERADLTEKIASLENPEPEEETTIPPPEDDNQVYHVTSEMTPPALLQRVLPEYPRFDSRIKREGRVILLIIIEKDGTVQEVRVLRSVSNRIDQAAVEAVKQWRYRPALMSGTPIRVTQVVGLNFEVAK
jgi:TonB family protein